MKYKYQNIWELAIKYLEKSLNKNFIKINL